MECASCIRKYINIPGFTACERDLCDIQGVGVGIRQVQVVFLAAGCAKHARRRHGDNRMLKTSRNKYTHTHTHTHLMGCITHVVHVGAGVSRLPNYCAGCAPEMTAQSLAVSTRPYYSHVRTEDRNPRSSRGSRMIRPGHGRAKNGQRDIFDTSVAATCVLQLRITERSWPAHKSRRLTCL